MFECIDFDEHLASFVTEYMQAHQKDYKNYDAMEADMPAIYVRFLNQPADWLDGLTPGSYFTQFEDPKDLVDWMIAYDQKGVAIPDLLLEQIENVGKPCEKRLVAILKDEEMSDALKMTAIGVLRTMESTQPKMLYIQWQMEREREDELADNALESLADMGRAALQPILEALPKANEAGQEALLDILANYPGKYVYIDFWSTGCGPCVSGIKSTVENRHEIMTKKYDKFAMIFITSDPEQYYEPFRQEWLEGAESYRISEMFINHREQVLKRLLES